jgi:hypothetical protein
VRRCKNITTENTNTTTKMKNVVLMGSKTYNSIPQKYRPLKDRINFVLTNDTSLHICSPYNINMFEEGLYYMNMDIFKKIYLKYNPNVFVIGGGQIYNYFLNLCTEGTEGAEGLIPQKLYITEVNGYSFTNENDSYTYMNDFRLQYRLHL